MTVERIYIFKRFERFWHWAQAALIMFLMLTGFEVHGAYTLFGFERATSLHTIGAWSRHVLAIRLAIPDSRQNGSSMAFRFFVTLAAYRTLNRSLKISATGRIPCVHACRMSWEEVDLHPLAAVLVLFRQVVPIPAREMAQVQLGVAAFGDVDGSEIGFPELPAGFVGRVDIQCLRRENSAIRPHLLGPLRVE